LTLYAFFNISFEEVDGLYGRIICGCVSRGGADSCNQVTPERVYILVADTKKEQLAWVEALKAVIAVHHGEAASERQMELIKEALAPISHRLSLS